MSSSISVAVRVRPFSDKERALIDANCEPTPTLFQSDPSSSSSTLPPPTPHVPSQAHRLGAASGHQRKIVKVLDDRILVFDPPDSSNTVATFQKSNLPLQGKKVKDIRFCFDRVFDEQCGQEEVYEGSAKELVGHVMDGFHSTVFAYGATGCGKTHTISGSPTQPGIVFLIMKDLFSRISAKSDEIDFSLSVSYLEIYNETIRDLLHPEAGVLQLRETPDGTASPAKLSTKEPSCAQDVVEWITFGNGNRTVNFTEANATSSRSHAVLRVTVTQKPKAGGLTDSTTSACLSVIDLAGSERASATKNRGERLTEGANINRSLLALGNCINALCDPRKRGHVPYRDSKLTRLLKQSLGGNCKTVMIVCIAPSSSHYDETHNTLQYANRAKEIKTKAIRNVISVDRHVAQYCQQIMQQSQEIERLKAQLANQQATLTVQNRSEEERAVRDAVSKVQAAWETGKLQKAAAAGAAAEKVVIEQLASTIGVWRSSLLNAVDATPSTSTTGQLRQDSQDLVNEITSKLSTLRTMAASETSSMNTFSRTLSSAQSTLRAQRPSAVPSFDYEIRLLDSRLDVAVADARSNANQRSLSYQMSVTRRLIEINLKINEALDGARRTNASNSITSLESLAGAVNRATLNALSTLAGSEAPRTSASSFGSNGRKRDSDTRSPLVAEKVWDKAPRQAAIGLGSAPSGSLAAQPTKKSKGVKWRDDSDCEGELEEIKYATPDSSNDGFPNVTITSPTTTMWTASSTHPTSSDSALAAEMMAAKARSASATSALRTTRPSTEPFSFGSSSNSLSSVFASPLPSRSSAPRSPFLDLANSHLPPPATDSSFSMAPGSSGLYTPLVSSNPLGSSLDVPMSSVDDSITSVTSNEIVSPGRRTARRVSNIGPLRTAKTSRRPSFVGTAPSSIDPNSSLANTSLSAPFVRKASRVVSGPASLPSSSSSSSSINAPLQPSTSSSTSNSLRKSPRKLLSHLIGGGAATRRLSKTPSSQGLAAAAGILPTAPVSTTFGQKSAARIAARRASGQPSSSSSGNNSGSNLNIGGRSIASALGGGSKKDSPTLNHPPVWR